MFVAFGETKPKFSPHFWMKASAFILDLSPDFLLPYPILETFSISKDQSSTTAISLLAL